MHGATQPDRVVLLRGAVQRAVLGKGRSSRGDSRRPRQCMAATGQHQQDNYQGNTHARFQKKIMGITWLFDLDNTLHDALHAIFPAINVNMNRVIAQVLSEAGAPAAAADVAAARIAYWQRYGATLLGMVKHHQMRADTFLHEAHLFENLPTMIRAERGLAGLLRRLPGRKILLTNAPQRYSQDVMRHLGLQRHFARHVAIESMRVHGQLRPKPSRSMLRKLLAREGVHARQCVLVEDTLMNLKSARVLGLRTVLVTQYLPLAQRVGPSTFIKRPAGIDVKVRSVKRLAGQLHRLRSRLNLADHDD